MLRKFKLSCLDFFGWNTDMADKIPWWVIPLNAWPLLIPLSPWILLLLLGLWAYANGGFN